MDNVKKIKGTVKWFNRTKGYGFINGDDGETYFAHYKNIAGDEGEFKSLSDEDRVSFVGVEGDRGLKAMDIVVEKASNKRR